MAETLRLLEPTALEMRALVDGAMQRIVEHIETLPRQPASDVEGATALARSLRERLPEDGQPFEDLLTLLFDRAAPKSFNTAGPGYLAYIPGGGLFESAVADLIGDSLNRYVGVWLAAPGLAQLEANVVGWLCQIVGFPDTARGFLTSGGSLANFSAVVTARASLLGENFLSGTIYTSEHAHHSIQKAAILAGFPPRNVRSIKSDEHFRVRIADLERSITSDRGAGLSPFMIVGNAGTTNTGAVDDLVGLAAVAEEEGLWLHADAAYGGFFMLTERGRRALNGIERCHSVTLDPHKGMFLPYGTGSLLVRDGAALEKAHAAEADYLPDMPDAPDIVDFSRLSPELSRPFRGVRVWLPVKLRGIGAFRRALDEKLDLATWAAEQLRQIPNIEIVAEPQLSIVVFRLQQGDLELTELNHLNRRLIALINGRQRIYLSGTMLDGRFVLRICVLSFRTHMDRMREGLEDIRAAVADVVA